MIYDTDTRRLYQTPGHPVLQMTITRGDAVSLMIQLQPPAPGARVGFAARPEREWSGVPGLVAYATTNAEGVAWLDVQTITTELDTALGVGTGRELDNLILTATVSLINDNNTRRTSSPIRVCYHNNIDRPGYSPDALVPYPPADRLVTYETVEQIVEESKKGEDGKSAYEIAQANGYKGTEAQWLESLKGSAVARGATYRPSITPAENDFTLSWTNDGGLTNPAPVTFTLPKGDSGKSAYELAAINGFPGTEAQWLASLKGTKGDPGLSAYQTAVDGGYKGTAADWIASLKGDPGLSAYQVARAGGYSGTEAQWLASLKGTKGDTGLSAYQSAKAGGYAGTEAQWLASLKGDKGDKGLSAYQVAQAGGYSGTEAQWLASLKGDVNSLLSQSNQWTENQSLSSGKYWKLGGAKVTYKITTEWPYTGYEGIAMHNVKCLMLFKGESEVFDFMHLCPGGTIYYSVNEFKRTIILPRDAPPAGTSMLGYDDTGMIGLLKWIDPKIIKPTANWSAKPENEAVTKKELMDQLSQIR